ncbi:glycoside hydrolase family 31 protein [Sphingomonas morindae]|uniref:DUF5110 domain-containing protein n=1 Tax=Sphingomonas morindae TaxID=1541170 RepID=A0ABY4XDS3_9SPHN|nr:TIM-barrel domain-containing protein [Sphingomonas morindae]USI75003.1 DUF5110 domain-containing protein [Sphingomonas morindae]
MEMIGLRASAGMAALLAGVATPGLAWSQPAAPAAVERPSAATLTPLPHGVELREGDRRMRVDALTDRILRVRVARDGRYPEDASWAVPAAVRAQGAAVTAAPDGFATAALRVRLVGSPARLVVEDRDGHVISADADQPLTRDGRGFTLRKALPQGEHIFGLGDKTGSDFDRRGNSYVDWNTDAFGFTSSQDPIYKSIPFFIGVGGAGGSYGLLLDNSWRAFFDFGHRDADTIALGAPDGPIDYYLIAGPSTADVVRGYAALTGPSPMPPLWALGYQQSRYSYMSAAEVRTLAARLRAERVPTDVIWLDIDFQDRNRPFTVNSQAFPDFAGLIHDMGAEGLKIVAITDLHIPALPGAGYAPYESGLAGHHFVRKPDGSLYVAPVWPGPSVFPDFTETSARRWWGTLFKPFVADGVAGFWNDMNEPAIFETPTKTMPLDTVHRVASDDFAPRDASHAEIHNVFGMENSRATYEGLLALRPDERPFVMTRASYAGGQRYAVTWTGDNLSTWDHLRLSVHQLVNLGLSGFAYGAADVGGFAGGPSADLLTRWFEIGAFTPVFRDHSAKGTPRAEPWVDGPAHLAIRRRFVETRYRLMPYLYALADQTARTGDPIMRPVFYDYPEALNASCDQSMSFTLGKALLVAAPPKMESPQSYDVCLPAGGWYDFWTGQPVAGRTTDGADQPIQSATQAAAGPRTASLRLTEQPRLDRLPVFVRAGTILPRQPLVQSLSETPQGPLALDVYPGDDCAGVLYADDGHSLGYRRGAFLRQTVRCTVTPTGLSIRFAAREGRFTPWWRDIAITVHGWQGGGEARLEGRRIATQGDAGAGTLTFTLPAPRGAATLTLARN